MLQWWNGDVRLTVGRTVCPRASGELTAAFARRTSRSRRLERKPRGNRRQEPAPPSPLPTIASPRLGLVVEGAHGPVLDTAHQGDSPPRSGAASRNLLLLAWGLEPGLPWPACWLIVGLAVSFTYRHAADFSLVTVSCLPQPLFSPQAVILSVLLVTPGRDRGIYLAVHYGILVAEGMAWTPLPAWYFLASNVANASSSRCSAPHSSGASSRSRRASL